MEANGCDSCSGVENDAVQAMECLNGEFVRVGPYPKFIPVAGYHWYVSFFFSLVNFLH
ncbi:hypothetical protein RGQ29_012188 [Quercus rubra]|uniref:Uncharacterized protein n=1 Tax=Quercus rubra TaxID=3512 RepID=A0AAN7G321_QUERU|nr:hypothetical protein RGQ29_012188 [Quercus rubra]